MRPKRIHGEYSRVSWWTTEYETLRSAHATPLTRESAPLLAGALAELRGIRGLTVEWGYPYGRGGGKRGRPWIGLPRDQMMPGFESLGGLRVGLVLHELAHAACFQFQVGANHSRDYVRELDRLLREWKAIA